MQVKEIAESIVKKLQRHFDNQLKEIREKIDNLPKPEKGDKGDRGEPADIEQIKKIIDQAVEKAVAALPKAKDGRDGKDIDPRDMKLAVKEEVEKAVSLIDIPSPRHGQDGRDAVEIEILPEIETEKSYARGTYAKHNGGLWRAYERTHGMRGWEVIVDGVASFTIEQKGQRQLSLKAALASGNEEVKTIDIPAIIYKEVYKAGESYERGDCVTWAGSLWMCLKDTDQKPGAGSEHWKLAVKAGRNASQSVKVSKE